MSESATDADSEAGLEVASDAALEATRRTGRDVRLLAVLRDFEAAAGEYRRLAGEVAGLVPVADDARLTAGERKVMGIVFTSCVPYIEQGAQAIEEAAGRMRAKAGVPVGDAERRPERFSRGSAKSDPQLKLEVSSEPAFDRVPEPADDLPTCAAARLEGAARELYAWVRRLTDDAEALGDRELAGDTHPYGDVVYGICIPYLVQASDIARRLSGGSAQPA